MVTPSCLHMCTAFFQINEHRNLFWQIATQTEQTEPQILTDNLVYLESLIMMLPIWHLNTNSKGYL